MFHKTFTAARACLLASAMLCLAAGCSDEELRRTSLQLKAETARARHDLPALGLATITSNRITAVVSGVRKAGNAELVRESDQFHIGSNLKAMLTTVLMQLVREGRLSLDITVEDVLPEIAGSQLENHRHITLEELLTHRSGLLGLETSKSLLAVPEFSGTPVEQRLQFTAWVLSKPAEAARGAYHYSNAAYAIAAAMAERVTNKSWDVLLQERLLQPLGIRARFDWPAAGHRAQPWGHERLDGNVLPNDPDDPDHQVPAFLEPAGHISMSLGDYAKFVQLHLRGLRGNAQLLDPAAFTEMHRPRGEYALGWGVLTLNGQPISWHEGSLGTFDTLVIVQPDTDRAVVVVTNVSDEGTLTSEAVTQVALELIEGNSW